MRNIWNKNIELNPRIKKGKEGKTSLPPIRKIRRNQLVYYFVPSKIKILMYLMCIIVPTSTIA